MPGLSLTTRSILAMYRVSAPAWTRYWFPDEVWRGDVCGCPDVGCVGVHHGEQEQCRCLRFGLRAYFRQAA